MLHEPCLLESCHKLARIPARIQHQPCLWDVLKLGLDYLLAFINLKFAILQRFSEYFSCLGELVHVINHDEPFACEPGNDDLEPVLDAEIVVERIVGRDSTTAGDASKSGHAVEHQIRNFSPDIVEVYICEAIWTW